MEKDFEFDVDVETVGSHDRFSPKKRMVAMVRIGWTCWNHPDQLGNGLSRDCDCHDGLVLHRGRLLLLAQIGLEPGPLSPPSFETNQLH